MQQGSDPSQFKLSNGESVVIRVVGVGTSQLELVSHAAERLEGDCGPGNVYRYTASGEPGSLKHLLVSFAFPEKLDPPACYRVIVEGSGGQHRFEAPAVFQPALGAFPQNVPYALTFVIG